MIRIGEVKDDDLHYNGPVDMGEPSTPIKLLEEQEKMGEDLKSSERRLSGYIQSYHYTLNLHMASVFISILFNYENQGIVFYLRDWFILDLFISESNCFMIFSIKIYL